MNRIYLTGLLVPTNCKFRDSIRPGGLAYISTSALSEESLGEIGESLMCRLERHGGALSFPAFRLFQTAIGAPAKMSKELKRALEVISPNTLLKGVEFWVMWQRFRPVDVQIVGTRVVWNSVESSIEILAQADQLVPSSQGLARKLLSPEKL